mgnify:CR=1 FL=1
MELTYSTINLSSSRNLITFNDFELIDISILNLPLINLVEIFKSNPKFQQLESGILWTIRANKYNWMVILKSQSHPKDNPGIPDIYSILEDVKTEMISKYNSRCCYIEIDDKIIQNEKYLDIWNDIEIKYHPKSFRQPDDNIRTQIITYFQNIDKPKQSYNDTIYLIGGECVLFGKIMLIPEIQIGRAHV